MPNTVSMPLGEGMKPDVLFESGELRIVGVFDMPADYEKEIRSDMALVVSDEYFDEFSASQCYLYGIIFDNDRDRSDMTVLLRNMGKEDYFYSLPYSFTIYDICGVVAIFKRFSWALVVLIIILELVLISSCYSGIINDQKRNVGIMRAMGIDRSYITKLYMSGLFKYAVIIPIATSLLFAVLTKIGNSILSKNMIGLEEPCEFAEEFLENYIGEHYDCIIVDEVQFLAPEIIDRLSDLVDTYGITVICYGLRTDFQSHLFPGAQRLMELADDIEQIRTICWCGKRAHFNARLLNGEMVTEGEQVQLGGNESYISLCRKHYKERRIKPQI